MITTNKNLAENAYACWIQQAPNEDSTKCIDAMTEKLFQFIKKNAWYGPAASLFPSASKGSSGNNF